MKKLVIVLFCLCVVSVQASVLVTKSLNDGSNDKLVLMFLDNAVVETCMSQSGVLNQCRQFKIEQNKLDNLFSNIELLKSKNLKGSGLSQQVKQALENRFEQVITVNRPQTEVVSVSYYNGDDLVWGVSISDEEKLRDLYPRLGEWKPLVNALNIVNKIYTRV